MIQTSTYKIAWRNLGRHKKRTALAIMAIAVGQFGLLASNGLMHGYYDNIRNAITGALIGHVQIHAQDWRSERALDLTITHVEQILTEIRQTPSVTSLSPRIYAPVLAAPKRDAFSAVVVGLDIASESASHGILPGLNSPLDSKNVLIGHILARKLNITKGDEIAVIGQAADGSIANDLYHVQAIIKSPADILNQSGIVMNLSDAQELLVMPDQAHEIVVRAAPDSDSWALSGALAKLPALHIHKVLAWQAIVPEYVLVLNMINYVGYFVLVLVFIAAIAGVTNTLMMSTFERLHEFGMLLALGSRPRRLIQMILVEAIILGVIGLTVGTVLGYVHTMIFARTGIDMASWSSGAEVSDLAYKGLNLPLNIYPRLELFDTLIGFLTIMLTSLLAAIWPACIAARLEPVEAMSS